MPNLGPDTHIKTRPATGEPKEVATTDATDRSENKDDKTGSPSTTQQDQPSSSTGHVPAAPADDQPQREDEHLSDFLQDSNPEKNPGNKKA